MVVLNSVLGVTDTVTTLLDCICAQLLKGERPACVCGITVGSPAISAQCTCDDGGEGALYAQVLRIYRGDYVTGADTGFNRKPCVPANWTAQIQITLVRCFPTIDSLGNQPSIEEQTEAAEGFHTDMSLVATAINCCVLAEAAYLETMMVEQEPSGGLSYLYATLRVPVDLRPSKNV